MRPVQRPEIIVDVKGRRHPVRLRAMAAFTVRRQAQVIVVRVRRLVIIVLVAARTFRRGIVEIAADVTGQTVTGNVQMRPRERIETVVKVRGAPGRFRVACRTVGRKLQRLVVRVRRLVVIAFVAAKTVRRGVIKIPVNMAHRTFIRNICVCPI